MKSAVDISNWGTNPPQAIVLLASAVKESSRAKVAERLGVSRTSVSLLLSNKYIGGTEQMQARVLDVLGDVKCPVLGSIPMTECQKNRTAKFTPSNPQRVQLFRACKECPNNPECGGVSA